MCLGRCCHAIYAIARNGLWDDPAEAVTGTIYKRFQQVVEESGIRPDAAIYLTWRFSYLICHVVFALIWGAVSFGSFTPDRSGREETINQFPFDIQPKRFETFVTLLSWWEPFLMYVWAISYLLALFALVCAKPSFAVKYARLSRRMVWLSWLWNFALPFTVLLVFPLRYTIDWAGVHEDLCVTVVNRALGSPGIDMSSALASLQQQGPQAGFEALQSAVQEQMSQDVTINDMPVRTWCQQQGTTWHTVFCDDVMRCVVTADQRCREEVCEGAPVAERATCQTRCLEYSQTSQRQEAVTFAQSMDRECGNFQQRSSSSSRNPLAGGVTIPGVNFSTECGEVATQQAEMFNMLTQQQSMGSQDACTYATLVVNNVDFLAGIFVGMEAGTLLLPSAMSVLGGLAESLYNVKALFPGHQEVPWVLVLTSFEALPIYTALLAIVQQLLGDYLLTISCFGFISWIALPAFTGFRSLNLHTGSAGRWNFYRKVWVEYGIRVLLIVLIAVPLNFYLRDRVGAEFRPQAPVAFLIITMLDYYTRKTLTAVAGTDAMTSTFLQCKSWREMFTAADKAANTARVEALAPILLASSKTYSSPADVAMSDIRNTDPSQEEDSLPKRQQGAQSGEQAVVVSPHEVQDVHEMHEVHVSEAADVNANRQAQTNPAA